MKYDVITRKGFSLIEMLLVLGVLAVLLIAAFVVYPRVRDASRANNEVANLTLIKANIQNMYASTMGDYKGLDTEKANNAKVFPQSMNAGVYTGAGISSTWGQPVRVNMMYGADADLAVNKGFTIEYIAVPSAICLGMVSASANMFNDIRVGSGTVMLYGSLPRRLDVDAATKECSAETPNVTFFSN